MTTKILVDLSHNENYTRVPSHIFDIDFIFDFIGSADHFLSSKELEDYDLVILGEIIPAKNRNDHLFNEEEIKSIKRYVKNGGRLLITSSSGGDFDYTYDEGSLRALMQVTGVSRFWWGELFHNEDNKFYEMTENLVFTEFPIHDIFKDIKKIVLADCTFLEPIEKPEIDNIMLSEPNTNFRYFSDDYEEEIGEVPIIITRSVDEGKTLTISSTLFMTNDKKYGISVADNGKLFENIVNWLLE